MGALSAVLFVPEIILFLGLSLTGLGIQEAQFLFAVLNFVVLALTVLGAWLTVRSLRHGAITSAAVAAYSWFAPWRPRLHSFC